MTDNLPAHWAIVGRGRLGTTLAAALRDAGLRVDSPLGRGADAAGADAVLLCVPDGEIGVAAASIAPGPLVGHCSGALGLDVLDGREAFGLHPLMTVTAAGADFTGAGCAVAGTTARGLAAAYGLARCLGMRAVEIADEDQAAYHAAAAPRAAGRRIALVPTMGAFHEGHLSLIRRAREQANVVVVSLFVNPTQFRPGEDLTSHPRDEARDAALAEAEGADLLFAPSVEE